MTVRNAFWILVALFALWAFIYGAIHPPKPPPIPAPTALPRRAPVGPERRDLFSGDPVIAGRTPRGAFVPGPARLVAMVGLCGASLRAERTLLAAHFPWGVDLDPRARDARSVAAFAHSRGDPLFIHVNHAPDSARLARWRTRFGSYVGIGTQHPNRMLAALAGSNLVLFDERGASSAEAFSRTDVRLIRRDIRIDDRASVPYIEYMLEQATALARRRGIVVVLLRPRAADLQAFNEIVKRRGDVQVLQPATAERT
ncbi:MAG TPA: divergent polysaccharide deacetylase family protein [Candidatus Dormibacteraeota bacterium]|nr:divergent polysaccharide deacetylase family protein [Candidatus Dormibacteraeota bacterium]